MARAGSRVRTLQHQISVFNWTPCLSTVLPAVRLRYFFVHLHSPEAMLFSGQVTAAHAKMERAKGEAFLILRR